MPIIVGYVPTPEGRAALERAVEEARLRNARLVVLNTTRGESFADKRFASGDQWASVEAELADSGVEYELAQLVEGKDAADSLLDAAAAANAELIVIGLRRRTPVGKLIMGSQAQSILLSADCPVLAVKAPARQPR